MHAIFYPLSIFLIQAKAEVDRLQQLTADRSTLAFGSALVRQVACGMHAWESVKHVVDRAQSTCKVCIDHNVDGGMWHISLTCSCHGSRQCHPGDKESY